MKTYLELEEEGLLFYRGMKIIIYKPEKMIVKTVIDCDMMVNALISPNPRQGKVILLI